MLEAQGPERADNLADMLGYMEKQISAQGQGQPSRHGMLPGVHDPCSNITEKCQVFRNTRETAAADSAAAPPPSL